MINNKDIPLCDLFQRFCDEPKDSWRDAIDALNLDATDESELLDLLESQTGSIECLDSPPFEAFPRLAAIEPTVVDGFEIIRRLGSGGMGIVYLAEQIELGRYVALKMLPNVLTASPNAALRFRNEAESAGKLSHANIVTVHRFGPWDDTYYIAAEYIEGETLAQRISRTKGTGGDQRWLHETLEHIRSIASALDHAHQHGVIHRDVKPANILINAQGVAHLADFGVAKSDANAGLTSTSETPGTLGYMSPEQAGLLTDKAGARSDVYSLGAVLFECITLTRLRPSDSALAGPDEVGKHPRIKHLAGRMKIPADLRIVCQKALEWDPAHRYSTAGAFAEDLDRVICGVPIHARKPGMHRAITVALKRRKAPIILAAAAVLAAVGIATPLLMPDPPPSGRMQIIPGDSKAIILLSHYDTEEQKYKPAVRIGKGNTTKHLSPGRYLITMRYESGIAEFSRDVMAGETYEVAAPQQRNNAVLDGMILIPGGEMIAGFLGSSVPPHNERVVALEPFWIDRTETTNAQYREFVLATGADAPPMWEHPYDPAIDQLPVTGINYLQAKSYAEWAGKRLPTAWEWERAARGNKGFKYPWGNDYSSVSDPGNIGVPGNDGWNHDYESPELRAAVISNLHPANVQSGSDITKEGGLHFYGNVGEFSDSPAVAYQPADAPFSVGQVLVKGKHWNGEGDGFYTFGSFIPLDHMQSIAGIGFRCARSVDPEPGQDP